MEVSVPHGVDLVTLLENGVRRGCSAQPLLIVVAHTFIRWKECYNSLMYPEAHLEVRRVKSDSGLSGPSAGNETALNEPFRLEIESPKGTIYCMFFRAIDLSVFSMVDSIAIGRGWSYDRCNDGIVLFYGEPNAPPPPPLVVSRSLA